MTKRLICTLLISIFGLLRCASYVKIPVVTQMPEAYAKRMADVKVVALAV